MHALIISLSIKTLLSCTVGSLKVSLEDFYNHISCTLGVPWNRARAPYPTLVVSAAGWQRSSLPFPRHSVLQTLWLALQQGCKRVSVPLGAKAKEVLRYTRISTPSPFCICSLLLVLLAGHL